MRRSAGVRPSLDGPVEEVDRELVRLARGGAALRLRLGEILVEMVRRVAHQDLGFSSIDAFVRERCGLDARWAADSRALARKLAGLPRLRAALMEGAVGWCMAEVVAGKATAESEAFLVGLARRSTVRRMKALLASSNGEASPGEQGGHGNQKPLRSPNVPASESEPEAERERGLEGSPRVLPRGGLRVGVGGSDEIERAEPVRLCLRRMVPRESAELFEDVRGLVRCHVGSKANDAVWEALLAEGLNALAEHVDESALPRVGRRRVQGEEEDPPAWEPPRVEMRFGPMPESPRDLDREARGLARELGRRELRIGELALEMGEMGGYKALGYASEGQYCRERLGCSARSVEKKRWLARHASRFPELMEAIEAGRVGVEAARLVTRVARQDTVAAWVAHAERRTFKHLRQDVERVETEARLRNEAPVPPKMFGGLPVAQDDPTAVKPRHMGRVELAVGLSRELVELFLLVEGAWERAGRPYGEFLRFLCVEW
ncbi:MAG: hypothetical protein ACODAG_01070, partial [Myxococcota bacterium]